MAPRQTLKIGLLISQTGPFAAWSVPSQYSACLAAAELNRDGGINGQLIEFVLADAGWEDADASSAVRRLIDFDEVAAIVAMHASNSRSAVSEIIADRLPYIYAPQHEVGDLGFGTIATGGADDLLLLPAIPWMMEKFKARSFFIVGSDYVWPWRSTILAGKIIKQGGGSVVGTSFHSVGDAANPKLFERIRRAKPDVVVQFLAGSEAIAFNRAYALQPSLEGVRRLALASDETVLLGCGPDSTEEFYVAAHYFSSLRSAANQSFMEQYRTGFGEAAPTPNALGQSCYEAVHALAGMISAAGIIRPTALRSALRGRMTYRSARADDQRAWPGLKRPIYLGKADHLDFEVVQSFQGASPPISCWHP